ncbi:WD40 repeat domain-containing protein [Streptomyces sp. NBC_00203]|uniref:WD40 repeat domain-containing protein n=1 Tax=Streptomyces sp. NBC_00203 TaxID=2975680 RepID=UPI0032460B9B
MGDLPQRRAERTRLVFDCVQSVEGVAVVGVDDADGAFVRLEGLPDMPDPRVCGLSSDGTKILFNSSREFDTSLTRLCLLHLPTGDETWRELTAHTPRDTAIALSPDGGSIAVLSDAEREEADGPGRACLDVVDIASGTCERLWTSPTQSWSSWECGVVWSPDGQLISITHMCFDHKASDDDWETVVVIDAATGAALHRLDFHGHVGWLNNRDLLTWTFDPEVTVLDTGSGALRNIEIPWDPGQSSGGTAGALHDRIVVYRGFNHGPYAYVQTDPSGQDIRPLFTTDVPPGDLFLASDTQPLDHLGQARPGTGSAA